MALPVDDRLRWVKLDAKGLVLKWWERDEARAGKHPLTLDIVSGDIWDARGGALPADVQPFFEEPLPGWLLDDLYAEWAAQRAPTPDWEERALEEWQPGELLSSVLADPTRRPDTFVYGDRTYVVDLLFCAAPGCACTENRLIVVEEVMTPEGMTPEETLWDEIGAFELEDDQTPRSFHGAAEHEDTAKEVFLLWRERSVHPAARVAELRARTRERGAVLHALHAKRTQAREQQVRERQAHEAKIHARAEISLPMPAVARAGLSPEAKRGVGRNDPCPCGSGQKFKRCCGRTS